MPTETAVLRRYEAWTVELCADGGREITDECGHMHDTLADAREHHRFHPGYNVIVALDMDEQGFEEVAREYRHAPRRPKAGWNRLTWDMVNRPLPV